MNNNRCVICNSIIPEGQQVCFKCFVKATSKRIAITAVALSALPAPIGKSKAATMGTLCKDVNFDGVIDSRDASLVLAEYANVSAGNSPTFTRTQQFVADVNLDGEVTAVDASMILSTYALTSTQQYVPIKTVNFGVTYIERGRYGNPLNYQAYVIEDAQEYIDSIRDSYPKDGDFTIVAAVTIWEKDKSTQRTYTVT